MFSGAQALASTGKVTTCHCLVRSYLESADFAAASTADAEYIVSGLALS